MQVKKKIIRQSLGRKTDTGKDDYYAQAKNCPNCGTSHNKPPMVEIGGFPLKTVYTYRCGYCGCIWKVKKRGE